MVDFKIKEKKEEKLFKRTVYDIEATLGTAPTPSREELKPLVAKFLEKDNSLLIIGKIDASFGESRLQFRVRVYDDLAVLKAIELPHLIERNKILEQKTADNAEKAEEKPKETQEEKPKETQEEKQQANQEEKPGQEEKTDKAQEKPETKSEKH